MPCTLPLGLESGVFMSACASNQIKPDVLTALPVEVARYATDRTDRDRMIAAHHQAGRTRAASRRIDAATESSSQAMRDLWQELGVSGRLPASGLGLFDRDVAQILDVIALVIAYALHSGWRRATRTAPCRPRAVPVPGRAALR